MTVRGPPVQCRSENSSMYTAERQGKTSEIMVIVEYNTSTRLQYHDKLTFKVKQSMKR